MHVCVCPHTHTYTHLHLHAALLKTRSPFPSKASLSICVLDTVLTVSFIFSISDVLTTRDLAEPGETAPPRAGSFLQSKWLLREHTFHTQANQPRAHAPATLFTGSQTPSQYSPSPTSPRAGYGTTLQPRTPRLFKLICPKLAETCPTVQALATLCPPHFCLLTTLCFTGGPVRHNPPPGNS